MKGFNKIDLTYNHNSATIWLALPQKKNALDAEMLEEVKECFRRLNTKEDISTIIIRGKGGSFCTGANIDWMNSSGNSTPEKCSSDSRKLSECFNEIYNCDKQVITVLYGHAYGGAAGFIGAGDFALAEKNTLFALPEVKLGLVPSVILPYLLLRIKPNILKKFVFTGEQFTADEALDMGLIDEIYANIDDLELKVDKMIHNITKVSSTAISEFKKLMRQLNGFLINQENLSATTEIITKLKMSEEARKIMTGFLLKA